MEPVRPVHFAVSFTCKFQTNSQIQDVHDLQFVCTAPYWHAEYTIMLLTLHMLYKCILRTTIFICLILNHFNASPDFNIKMSFCINVPYFNGLTRNFKNSGWDQMFCT